MPLEPMTEEEMYAIEFHDCELHEDEPEEEAENEYHCPVCHATELQYAMHYPNGVDLFCLARGGCGGFAGDSLALFFLGTGSSERNRR